MGKYSLNQTSTFDLKIFSFDIHPSAEYPIFVIGLLVYLFSVFSNVTILVLIVTQRSLHRPMFYILFSLPLNDLIGITAMFPRVLVDIITKNNTVYYPLCVFQAFLIHMFGGGTLFILAAMAFDRYIAICKPLRYHSIMTPLTVVGILSLAWGLDFAIIFVLFLLQTRVQRCTNFIMTVYCSNVSLLNLSCGEDVTINNIYGLIITIFMHVVTITIQLFSYIQIILTCIFNRQSDAKTKAVNTCLAQIIVFLIFEIVSLFTLIAYRLPNISTNARNACGMMIFLILPIVNPVIYGMKTKDIRITFFQLVRKKATININVCQKKESSFNHGVTSNRGTLGILTQTSPPAANVWDRPPLTNSATSGMPKAEPSAVIVVKGDTYSVFAQGDVQLNRVFDTPGHSRASEQGGASSRVPTKALHVLNFNIGGVEVREKGVVIVRDDCIEYGLLGMNVVADCWAGIFQGRNPGITAFSSDSPLWCYPLELR
ncbi:olfactory receptor 52B2-like [Alosa sapidissima]|uniref:olfactory receptor 52B2-like n=1 Tax=Alosa sapidissima TaxID=34773 RepID=UPI001C08CD32|nr:olfactory receptor 52B2-like [Alosa sapidissima]